MKNVFFILKVLSLLIQVTLFRVYGQEKKNYTIYTVRSTANIECLSFYKQNFLGKENFLSTLIATPKFRLPQANKKFSDLSQWSQLFRTLYKDSYQENKCYKNISNFVDQAVLHNLDLSNSYVVGFENTGSHMFGMVNALHVRNSGQFFEINSNLDLLKNPYNHNRMAGEQNFYHHVIFVKDDLVFDLSFANEPIILPFKEYIQKMFIPEEHLNSKEFANYKLKSYKFSFIDARLHHQYVKNGKDPFSVAKIYYLPELISELF